MRRVTLIGVRVITSLSVLGAAAACGASEEPDTGAAGQGPVIAVRDWNAYPAAEVAGRLSLNEGCLLVGGSVAFWADGTSWDAKTQSVVFESGNRVTVGQQFSGGGGHYSEGDLGGLEGVEVDVAASTVRTCRRDRPHRARDGLG